MGVPKVCREPARGGHPPARPHLWTPRLTSRTSTPVPTRPSRQQWQGVPLRLVTSGVLPPHVAGPSHAVLACCRGRSLAPWNGWMTTRPAPRATVAHPRVEGAAANAGRSPPRLAHGWTGRSGSSPPPPLLARGQTTPAHHSPPPGCAAVVYLHATRAPSKPRGTDRSARQGGHALCACGRAPSMARVVTATRSACSNTASDHQGRGGAAKWSSFKKTAPSGRPTTLHEGNGKDRKGKRKREPGKYARTHLETWQKGRARDTIIKRRQQPDIQKRASRHTRMTQRRAINECNTKHHPETRVGTSQTPWRARASKLSTGATSTTTAATHSQSMAPCRRAGTGLARQQRGCTTRRNDATP